METLHSVKKGCPPYSQPSQWELLNTAVPVVSSRQWTTALSPRAGGGWNFIGQSYPGQHDPDPVDQYVVQLETGITTITQTNREGYCHEALSIETQLRSANGKIWFPGHKMFLSWYDPADASIHELPQIVDSDHPQIFDAVFYTHEFGPDGILYLGTQSTNILMGTQRTIILPTVWAVDTVTDPPTVTRKGAVGKDRDPNVPTNYCYRIAPDTNTAEKWIYVCVGQSPWELAALNLSTGFMKILPPSVPSNGYMKFDAKDEGWVVTKYDPNDPDPNNRRKQYWCIDGAIDHEYFEGYDPSTLPFTARSVKAAADPLTSHPGVDASAGVGLVKWVSPTGWKDVPYTVTNKRPQNIESLTTLPARTSLTDETILGNVNQYQGFFRYTPRTHKVEWYGNWANGLSKPNVLVHSNGLVYLAGYPNCALYAYTPSKQWNPPANPTRLGYYHSVNGAKYNSFLVAAGNGRIYSAGRCERDFTGSGVGYCISDGETGKFYGNAPDISNLAHFNPQGLIVDDANDRVVLSTIIDTNVPSPPAEAQLIVYNLDLLELTRYSVKPPLSVLKDTGALFMSNIPGIVIGLSRLSKLLYRFDILRGTLLAYRNLPFVVSNSWQDPLTGCIYVAVGPALYTINKATLELLPLIKRPEIEQLDESVPNHFCVSGTKFVVANKSNLYTLGDI